MKRWQGDEVMRWLNVGLPKTQCGSCCCCGHISCDFHQGAWCIDATSTTSPRRPGVRCVMAVVGGGSAYTSPPWWCSLCRGPWRRLLPTGPLSTPAPAAHTSAWPNFYCREHFNFLNLKPCSCKLWGAKRSFSKKRKKKQIRVSTMF